MASSSMPTKKVKLENTVGLIRNWVEVPKDVTSNILKLLGAVDLVMNARQVCPMWREICRDPLMWRSIEMINGLHSPHNLEKICMYAVDQGGDHVEDINVEYFVTDELVRRLAERTSNLRRIRISKCLEISDTVFTIAAKKFSLLEDLELSFTSLNHVSLEAIGQNCPLLKTLKFNQPFKGINCGSYKGYKCNKEALAIAKTMPELRHLELWGNKLTNDGLIAIFDGCPYLESLDVRMCYNLVIHGNLAKKCFENTRMKYIRYPTEYINGFDNDDDDDFVYEFYCECRARGSKGMKRKFTHMDFYKFH